MGERKPRGELAELSAQLQGLCSMGKRSKQELSAAKREAFKKVINYMTLGMDMSSLFPMMTSCANLSSEDLVLKKMLYLYITHYATQTPDLALLTINQLHKDCHDQDPLVRGLALRSLCSLRIPNFLEYVVSPVNQGLEDRHPYVRRTAVMGVLKIQHIDANVVANTGMMERVRALLQSEQDTQVVANCLQVMVSVDDPVRLANNKVLLYGLLNRIKEFTDWSQCLILELASHYTPGSESEVFELLNALEDRLNHVNSAVVVAAIKVFLHLTLSMTATHQQVLERVKEPLKSLISRDDPSTSYAALCHALLLVGRAPMIFEQDYVAFYCRTHDPWYIKKLKMGILTALASSTNVYDIVSELTEYARDISPAMAREAVRAVGRIALAVSDVNGIVERLLLFLESGSDHIIAQALIQLKDLLRRYPDLAQVFTMGDITPSSVTEPEARAALVWILGHFGEHIQSAPYLLEPLAASFASEHHSVRLALLTAGVRLFFKRPPESQALLGALLAAGLNDSDQDVHDRTLFYYRLLRYDPSEAERVVAAPLEPLHFFAEELSAEAAEQVFAEFNTLSVVYQQPASQFVQATAYHSVAASEPPSPSASAATTGGVNGGPESVLMDPSTNLLDATADEADLLDLGAETGGGINSAGPGVAGAGPGSSSVQQAGLAGVTGSLLDLDVGLGMAPAAPPPGPPRGLTLNPVAKIMPGVFQERWRQLPPAHQYSDTLNMATVAALASNGHKDFCAHMGQAAIMTIASGGQPPMYRYYFYGQAAAPSSALFLVEMVVATEARQASIIIKTDSVEQIPAFVELWRACLAGFYR